MHRHVSRRQLKHYTGSSDDSRKREIGLAIVSVVMLIGLIGYLI